MTEHRVRHLPVWMEARSLASFPLAIWSIGSFGQRETISHLQNYISGQYQGKPGSYDSFTTG